MQPSLQDWLNRKPKGPAPRKRIPAKSAKRKALDPAYARAVSAHLKANPFCQVGPIIKAGGFPVICRGKATHVHHVKGRVGALLCDRRHFLSSCGGECHPRWIHDTHKAEAITLGLLDK